MTLILFLDWSLNTNDVYLKLQYFLQLYAFAGFNGVLFFLYSLKHQDQNSP